MTATMLVTMPPSLPAPWRDFGMSDTEGTWIRIGHDNNTSTNRVGFRRNSRLVRVLRSGSLGLRWASQYEPSLSFMVRHR